MYIHKLKVPVFILSVLVLTGQLRAQDRTVLYGVADPGVSKTATWGLDTAWYDENNVRRGGIFMGTNNVDIVRISFTTADALVGGQLGADQLNILTNRLTWVDRWANPLTTVCINQDTPTIDPWYFNANGTYNITNWAANIAAHAQRAEQWGRTVVAVGPYNEPDNQALASMQVFYNTSGLLVTNSIITANNIRISGGNTLNTDQANPWFNFLKARLNEGNTHELAGSFDNFASFFQNVVTNGDHATDDEMHNVMEAMVGVEYGMQTGIWWGTAERCRGEFVKASHGVRLGYAENRPNWTAASVYRGTNGAVQGFVGESERQSNAGNYRFFSKDRDVFYDGYGPQRAYTVTTTGNGGYQTPSQHNAERVVNITWGADVQPAINGRYIIVNRSSHKVLEVPGGSLNNGVQLDQTTYTGATYQQWDVSPLPNTFGGDYSYFTIVNVNSSVTADLNNYSYANGEKIQQWNGGTNTVEQWILQYTDNGYFKIRNRWCNKVMSLSGNLIVQSDDTGSTAQQWKLVPVGAIPTDFAAPGTVTGVNAIANARSVQLSWNASTATDLGGYTVLRSTNSGGPYDTVARSLTNNAFTDKFANQTKTYYYIVKAVDKSLNSSGGSAEVSATPTGGSVLIAHYAFDGGFGDDTVNANNPIVTNGSPTFVTGTNGSAMNLDGSSQYVMLPANMLADVTNFTIAAWVYWNGGAAWQRIFDFGNSPVEYFFLTPSSGGGTLRFAVTTNNYWNEQYMEVAPLPVGKWQHVAVTLNGTTARLYTNGVLAASTSVLIPPASFNPALNYLGKSQYDADPLFNGRLEKVYVYNYALSNAEITRLMAGQPPPPTTPTTITAAFSAGTLNLSWPSNYLGCRLQVQTNNLATGLGTNWFDVAGSTTTNEMTLPVDNANGSVFYRLFYK